MTPETQYIKPCEQIRKYDDLVEIRKQSAVEQAEESDPESKVRTMTVLKLTDGLGLTEVGI
jgi:hypothetical protein